MTKSVTIDEHILHCEACKARFLPTTEEEMVKADNSIEGAIMAVVTTRRSELLKPFVDEISAGNVMTPKQQRMALISLCSMVDLVARHEERERGLREIVEAAEQVDKQMDAFADKLRDFYQKAPR